MTRTALVPFSVDAIADASVANAKLANMANATLKGRNTAGTGVPEDVTIAQLIVLLVLFTVPSFSKAGVLTTGTGTFRWYNRTGRTLTFDSVTASVGTAPTGATVIVDVNVDGTTIYSTQGNRPTIATSTNTHDDTTTPNTTTIADNSYLTIDVDQVGSTIAGSDLVVQVFLRG